MWGPKQKKVHVCWSQYSWGCVLLLTTLADEVYQSEWGFTFICLLNFERETKRGAGECGGGGNCDT